LRVQQLSASRIPTDRLLSWLDATVREMHDRTSADS
jgi:hypothetical protein